MITDSDFTSTPRRQQIIIVEFHECAHIQELPNYPNSAPLHGDKRWCFVCNAEHTVKAVRYEVRE